MNELDGLDEDMPGHPPAAWRRLGQMVRQRRIELGFGSQASLAAEGGPSLSVVNKIETGRGRDYTDRVIIPLEDRLGWRRGSFRSILDGGEPVLVDAAAPSPAPSPAPAAPAPAPAAEHSHDGNYPEEVVGDPFLRFIWDAPESLADDEDKWAAVTGVLLKRRRPVPRPLDEQQGRQRKADNI